MASEPVAVAVAVVAAVAVAVAVAVTMAMAMAMAVTPAVVFPRDERHRKFSIVLQRAEPFETLEPIAAA